MPGSIIVFSGMDGAGKSTQIDLLRAEFESRGTPSRVLWSRGGYTPGMNLAKSVARRLLGRKRMPASGKSSQRTQAFSNPWIRKLWLLLAIADLILLYGFWLRWHKLIGTTVICDRYLQDTRLDFELNFASDQITSWITWKCLCAIAVRPDRQFLMLVDAEEAERRSKAKNEPFPDPPDIAAARMRRYQEWQDDQSWITLDGNQPRNELAAKIWSVISPDSKPTAAV